jgi:hypothetical protein
LRLVNATGIGHILPLTSNFSTLTGSHV